jgi:hypothetical protein
MVNPAHAGFVNFIQNTNPMYWSVTAYFITNADQSTVDPTMTCTTEMAGACTFKTCMPVDAGLPPLPVYTSAGDVKVTGGTIPSTLALTMEDGGIYQMSAAGMDIVVKNGDTIKVTASGGDVPAFNDLQVVAAPSFMLTAPPCSTDCGSLDRTADMPVAWSGINAGKLHVVMFTNGSGPTQTITCDFSAADGKGAVPTTLLSKLPAPAGDGGSSTVAFNVQAMNDGHTVAGDYGVTLQFYGDNTGGTLTIAK